jgi:hypothetical protein
VYREILVLPDFEDLSSARIASWDSCRICASILVMQAAENRLANDA